MTHRFFSRNAASSRAIPITTMIANVRKDPFIPTVWSTYKAGMQGGPVLKGREAERAERTWLEHRDEACRVAEDLTRRNLSKQIVNRILEPWMWITVICTGTDRAYRNFFQLRCHGDAEPHMQKIAYATREALALSKPKYLEPGNYHLPLTGSSDYSEGWTLENLAKISVGRCARVSYVTHEGVRDPKKDITLHDKLVVSKHWSPFEHVAKCSDLNVPSGNFEGGWVQYRKDFKDECAL